MACIVEIDSAVLLETEKVRYGLPLTKKNRRFEEGRSRMIPRSLKEEITWGLLESGWVVSEAEMVKSKVGIW